MTGNKIGNTDPPRPFFEDHIRNKLISLVLRVERRKPNFGRKLFNSGKRIPAHLPITLNQAGRIPAFAECMEWDYYIFINAQIMGFIDLLNFLIAVQPIGRGTIDFYSAGMNEESFMVDFTKTV